jgi:intracellular septation protein
MKFLFDFLPIVLFFVAYKLGDIYIATKITMLATLAQLLISKFILKRLDKTLLSSAAIVFALGSLTLIFHNPNFIKWKPTLVYACMALALLVSNSIFKRNLIRAAMEEHLKLPEAIWGRLNLAWILFFVAMGITNIVVAYSVSEAMWVNFKLACIGITLLFCIGQMLVLARYLPKEPT